jgi:hypothetical protein
MSIAAPGAARAFNSRSFRGADWRAKRLGFDDEHGAGMRRRRMNCPPNYPTRRVDGCFN